MKQLSPAWAAFYTECIRLSSKIKAVKEWRECVDELLQNQLASPISFGEAVELN